MASPKTLELRKIQPSKPVFIKDNGPGYNGPGYNRRGKKRFAAAMKYAKKHNKEILPAVDEGMELFKVDNDGKLTKA